MKVECSTLIESHAVNMSSSDDHWRLPDNIQCSFNNVVPLCGMMRHVHMNVYMFKRIKVTRTNIITTTITHKKNNNKNTKWFRRKQTVSHERHKPQPLHTFHVKPTSSCFEETPMYIYIIIYIFIRCWLSAGFCWLTSCHVVPFKNSPFDGYPLVAIMVLPISDQWISNPATISIFSALILHKSTSDETRVDQKSAGTRVTARLSDDLLLYKLKWYPKLNRPVVDKSGVDMIRVMVCYYPAFGCVGEAAYWSLLIQFAAIVNP